MDEDIRQDYNQTMREFMEWRGRTTASLSIITKELEHIRSNIAIMHSGMTEIDKKCIEHLSQTGQIVKDVTIINRVNKRLDFIEKQMAETAIEVRINSEASDKRYKYLAIAISVFAVIGPATIAIVLHFL